MTYPDLDTEEQDDRKKLLLWAIPVVVVIGLAVALYYGRKHKQEPVAQQVQTETVAAAEQPPQSNVIEPQPGAETKPLPALSESDAPVQESLNGIFGRSLDSYLVPKDIIRHVVVTIDNLPRKKTSVQMWPLKPTSGELKTSGTEELTLSDANFARYEPLIAIVKEADTAQVAAAYKRFYPLFQQAYTELGYPDAYFNDRLIAVIDHLLETPEVRGPIELVQPGVFYEFADRTLEEKSAGQKLLIRMGSNHAAAVKLKLRELRREIAKRPG